MQGPLCVTIAVTSLGLGAACVTPGGSSDSNSPFDVTPIVLDLGNPGEVGPDQQRFLPGVEALRDSVDSGENDDARRILARLRARGPGEQVSDLLDAFERILDGRDLADRIDVRLLAQEVDGSPGDYLVSVRLVSTDPQPVAVRPAAVRLRVAFTSVDPLGAAQRSLRFVNVDADLNLDLEQDQAREVELVEVTLPTPSGMLALDAQFRLEFLATELQQDGRSLPASNMSAPELTLVRLVGYISSDSISPQELARYVDASKIRRPALMERAVRVVPSRRDEALDLLAPMIARMSMPGVQELTPALRWLTGVSSPGGDPEAWHRWMAARTAGQQSGASRDPATVAGRGLDLPRSR